MVFELKSVFQNEGEEKQVEYKLDMTDIDIDGVFPFKTPIDVTAVAKNRASLVNLQLRLSLITHAAVTGAAKNLQGTLI